MTVIHVPATTEHRVFIIDAWIGSYRLSHSAGIIAMDDWRAVMWPTVEKLLDRAGTRTLVAVEKRDQTAMYGFITVDTNDTASPFVFYIYVKEPYRRAGMARALFEAAGIDPRFPYRYACRVALLSKLTAQMPMARWDPLSARFPTTKEQTR